MLEDELLSVLRTELQKMNCEIQKINIGMQEMKAELRAEMQDMKTELRAEMCSEIAAAKNELLLTMQSELQPVKDDLRETKADLRDLRLYTENVVMPQIKILAENYVPAAQRYERTAPETAAIKQELSVIKEVLKDHSQKINALTYAADKTNAI